jgi:Tetratricopeptide Repeats-Sensor
VNGNNRKTCFVVMGFGEKTDYQSNPQRVLNLNRTFEGIIEPAVTAAGLVCIRADKIIHSTYIDKPMYEQLLNADVVIADLSTSNANAIYELGVRHALRPHTTIVMAEDRFSFPFDLNHVSIMKYTHLGPDIGHQEAISKSKELQTRIAAIMANVETDSPVYLFLPQLLTGPGRESVPEPASSAPPQDDKSLAELLALFRQTKKDVKQADDWVFVAAVLRRLEKLQPTDPYIVQQLALATYKSKRPTVLQALQDAQGILTRLKPDTSSDAETIGLWGAIHKRVWDVAEDRAALNTAIRAYARGYFIKDDYYNGINFAYLLNVRAAESTGDDAIADRVVARRIRSEVLAICDRLLASPPAPLTEDEQFWVNATKVEAFLGLGMKVDSDALRQLAINRNPPPERWMVEAMDDQLARLEALQP